MIIQLKTPALTVLVTATDGTSILEYAVENYQLRLDVATLIEETGNLAELIQLIGRKVVEAGTVTS